MAGVIRVVFSAVFLLCLSVCVCTGEVEVITDDNWSEMLSGQWMIEFYAPWCPHCTSFTPVWEKFGKWAESEDDLRVGSVDVTEQSVLAGQFLVMQLPTIIHIKDGIVREFSGSDRSYPGLRKYIIDEKWSVTDPISWYKSPTSLHMRVVGYLFVLSKKAQVLEEYIHEEYELPTWAIFSILAAVTIIIGLIIGGIFVFVCDFAARRMHSTPSSISHKLPQETRLLKPAKNDSSNKHEEGIRKRTVDDKKFEKK